MNAFSSKLVVAAAATLIALPAWAVEVEFKPIVDGVYANIGLVVTSAGAVLIDSGATFRSTSQDSRGH